MAIGQSLKLSGRELQIVRGVFDDQKETAIAIDLSLSVHTIHTHVGRLCRKLCVMDRAQLLQRVMQEFLVLTVSSENELPPLCPNMASGRCPFRI